MWSRKSTEAKRHQKSEAFSSYELLLSLNGVHLVLPLDRKTRLLDHRLFLNPNLDELYCLSKQADKDQR